MAATAEAATEKVERQGIYLERINEFFAQVKTWLTDDLAKVPIPRHISDETGEYDAFGMAIVKKDIQEPDDTVADLLPQGCSVLLAEGMIELDGPYGSESVVYLEQSKIMLLPRNGKTRPMFKGVDHDGWYWLEDPRRSRMLPMDSELLFELLEMVSGYESE